MNCFRLLITLLALCAPLCWGEIAAAAPEGSSQIAPSLRASIPAPRMPTAAQAPLSRPGGAARLQRRLSTRNWMQLNRGRPMCQPVVGQYSCMDPCDRCWRFMVGVPVWIPGISAQAGDGSVTAEGDRDPSDAVDGDAASDVEFAFVGAFLARRGRWGAGVDFLTASINASATFSIADGLIEGGASGKLSAAIARFRIDYLYTRAMVPWKLRDCGCAEHRVYVGARAYDIEVSASSLSVPGLSLDVGDTWVDPIIGFESKIPFARNWSFQLAGDVGGFDIAGNWSYSLLGGVHWRFAKRWGLTMAYQMLDLRRDFGGPGDPKKIDINLRGPQIALQFFF